MKREDRLGTFAGRSKSSLPGPSGPRDTAAAHAGEFLSHPASSSDGCSAARRRDSEKPAGDYRENAAGKYSQIQLQMKREDLQKLNRQANERQPGFATEKVK
jgi:hypothetical protein